MINSPIKTKIKCLKKKKQLFVSSLSDAIKEVDTREKKRPRRKSEIIIKNKVLSSSLHQLKLEEY